jgi:hypothetical protein
MVRSSRFGAEHDIIVSRWYAERGITLRMLRGKRLGLAGSVLAVFGLLLVAAPSPASANPAGSATAEGTQTAAQISGLLRLYPGSH